MRVIIQLLTKWGPITQARNTTFKIHELRHKWFFNGFLCQYQPVPPSHLLEWVVPQRIECTFQEREITVRNKKSGVGLSHHVKIVQSHMYNHQLIVTFKKKSMYIYMYIYIYCALPPPCNSRKNRWIGRRSLLQQMAIIWGLWQARGKSENMYIDIYIYVKINIYVYIYIYI